MAPHALAARHPATRSSVDLARVAMRAAGRLVLTALLAFHAWLIWAYVVDGRPFGIDTAVRWLVAVLVLAGFGALRRLGLPLFWGRRAVVLWLLVVVIHCHAFWAGGAVVLEVGHPEAITALAQLTASAASVLGLLFMGLSAVLAARRRPGPDAFDAPVLMAGLPDSGHVFRFFPRPPPLA